MHALTYNRGHLIAPQANARGVQFIGATPRAAGHPGGGDTADLVARVAEAFADHKEQTESVIDQLSSDIAALRVGGAGADGPANSANHRRAMANLGKFARSGRPEDLIDGLTVNAAMRTDSAPDGGYLVPEELDSEISMVQRNMSAMRGLARVQPVSSSAFQLPINTSAFSAGWVGERESRPETNSGTIAMLEFPAGEIYANPAVTQKLLDDGAYDVAGYITEQIGMAFSEQEGAAFITGDGINKPRGVLSYDTITDASWAWGKLGYKASGVAAAISDASNNGVDVLTDVVYALPAAYRQNASWLMNSKTAGTVRKLKDAYGQYLWQQSVIAGQPSTLLGYPVAIDEDMSDIGANAFPIAFGDFKRGYLITDRTQVKLLRDPFTNKPYVMFYATKRVGGGVSDFKAIKLVKIATS